METTTRRVKMSFETGLLWKYDHFSFPDSYPMAVRMMALETRLSRDHVLEAKVKETIAQYEAKGYAHRITPEELQTTDSSKVWYLPLGVVQNPKKPNKIRLIWDAKARTGGVSFNDMLMKGPDLLVALLSVVLRFRQRNIAVVGDIKEMFHQIFIRCADKQSQRFLFRKSPELSPQIYVMDVATFGATCSPSLAQNVKNNNAAEFTERFPRAAKAIIENHYVDDFLDSVDSEAEAVQLVNEVKYVHSQAGFEIRNFSSNSVEVLAEIGEQRAPQTVSLNLEKSSEMERVLGMVWRPTEDIFTFDLSTMKDEVRALIAGSVTPTKRQVLKVIMSLFDPLGLISHFVVRGKILMQLIWRSGTDWDELISEDLREKWDCWCRSMQNLDEVAVPRCYFKGIHSSHLGNIETHMFVDASELACAAVLYLRIADSGQPRCALVAAKTKVAPLKPLSVPRLELQAAMIGTRLLSSVLTSLDLPVSRRFLWCDSSTVLSWLRSDSRRYHQFVAFRVGEILTSTSMDEWNYVPSKLNVADTATKWKYAPSFDSKSSWYNAPDFLYKSPEYWPSKPSPIKLETDVELRAVFMLHGTIQPPLIDISRFSNWNRLLRATAYVIRGVHRFKGEQSPKPVILTQQELKNAENLLWRQIQADAYPDEVAILKRNRTFPESAVSIPKSSPIYRFSPFLDEEEIIRMNSRITAAPGVPLEAKLPVLLPKKHSATVRLVDQYHRRFLHGNGETVCNELRQRFCIPGLRGLIREVSGTNSKTRWHFNPPSAPHMGGSWERMVRSMKTAMLAIADHPHHPSDEVLETVLLEVEAIVNSRPLTYIPLEFAEQESLTPNHFLLFGTKGISQNEMAINLGGSALWNSWRLAQNLVHHFWTRWIREYLPTISRRTKWFEPTKPHEPGDLVLVVDEGKRYGWLRGQVVDVIKAADGQVRRAVVQTKNGLVTRPAVKLAPLDLKVSGSSGTTRPPVQKLGSSCDYYFQQDNDPKQTDLIVWECLLCNLPINSKHLRNHLNTIEHIWWEIKSRLKNKNSGNKVEHKTIEEIWKNIPSAVTRNLASGLAGSAGR
ncbi:uncharacterized protein LOC129766287 [Toxorhynchites rutilus septentrionalis]|uniref:uncharacterized protein LOC129766287 n=1 Tax=Toxorhynchites rutilus septentrionalis TaxID=329112 RepID=UPI002478A59B|nr:uncharacterized protein LOC129766287 [Toxorhynchites rutilus septentrionalis]